MRTFKQILLTALTATLLLTSTGCAKESSTRRLEPIEAKKPVIYLYPEKTTDVQVKLDLDGTLTTTYPKYDSSGGWQITAHPDGTLIDKNKQEYRYLYWEAESHQKYDFTKGFCVPGKESASFLEKALENLGLNRIEANEFIVYWLPELEKNPYNLLSFQTTVYTNHAKLDITPKPDTMIRIFLAWKPLEQPIDIPPQKFQTPTRKEFTVVEWGGTEVPNTTIK